MSSFAESDAIISGLRRDIELAYTYDRVSRIPLDALFLQHTTDDSDTGPQFFSANASFTAEAHSFQPLAYAIRALFARIRAESERNLCCTQTC